MPSCFLFLNYFPSLLKAGKSTAHPDEVDVKQKELKKNFDELEENVAERKKVDEQNTFDGDNDSPNESKSAEELEQ
jgi:hypothetical protein